MNVKKTFLYCLINQLVYVEILKETESESNRNMVCKPLKALFGFKQSSRVWYKVLSTLFLEKLGLKQINTDHTIFLIETGLNRPIVSSIVNDIKIMSPK